MRKLLLQLDSSRLPSVFDRVVAYDGGADEVMSYGGVVEADVRDLIHGCIFTRGPKDLKNTAVFVGGADIAVGEQLLTAATKAMFKPFTVSAMLDSNGSNTTALAAVAKMVKAVGAVRGKRVLIVAGTGPVGIRAPSPRRSGHACRGGVRPVRVEHRRHREGLEHRLRRRGEQLLAHRDVRAADEDGGVLQVLGTAREDAAVDQVADVGLDDAAVAHHLVGAAVVGHHPVEHARQPGAVELQQQLTHQDSYSTMSPR